MRLLIDGDILVYRCGFAAEKVRYFVYDKDDEGAPPLAGPFDSAAERNEWMKEHELTKDDVHIESERTVEPVENALSNVKSVINNITTALNSTDIMIALSQGECFRHKLATIKKYKGNRDDMPRPAHYDKIREYLTNIWGARTFTSVEADDVLALCQNDKSCIVSIDKDLLQVPGKHYNWVMEEESQRKMLVTPEIGMRKLYMQVLTGDSTDNIPGIRGVGPVKARAALSELPSDAQKLWDKCVAEWYDYLITERAMDDGFMFNQTPDGEEFIEYVPWDSSEYTRCEMDDVPKEVFKLVKVGGRHAKEAADASGEEIPYA